MAVPPIFVSPPETVTDTPDALLSALEDAHMPTLLLALAQITGDEKWLANPYRLPQLRGGNDPNSGGFSEEIQTEIKQAAHEAVLRWRAGEALPETPTDEQLVGMMSWFIGADQAPEGARMVAEEMGLVDRDIVWAIDSLPPDRTAMTVAIVGAGFGGLCMAIKLERARIPYVVLEREPDVGGTWWTNFYPGCAVDSPSHLYQYSFEPRADWPDYYSTRDEILAYIRHCANVYGIRDKIRFSTSVQSATWDEDDHRWIIGVGTPDGANETVEADVFVSSVGLFNQPMVPQIDGADTFAGPTLHSANWDRDLKVTGKRVAVIGTGATAMQLVPALAGNASMVSVFQRSPQWMLPTSNVRRPVSDKTQYLMQRVPYYLAWFRYRQFWIWNETLLTTLEKDPNWKDPERSVNAINDGHRRFLTRFIESSLEDRPDLLEKCLPTYPPYLKRMLMDTGWFETIKRDDVDLITEQITRITPKGVLTSDGVEHKADLIVYATGFHAHRMLWPMDIRGRDGVNIRDAWGDDDARAYLGITVPQFPNMFCIFGPGTGLGHGGSVLFHTELQVRYVMSMLASMLDRELAAVEIQAAVHDDYNVRRDAAHDRLVWSHDGASTWYRNSSGRVSALSPWKLVDYWKMTLKPDLTEYHLTSRT